MAEDSIKSPKVSSARRELPRALGAARAVTIRMPGLVRSVGAALGVLVLQGVAAKASATVVTLAPFADTSIYADQPLNGNGAGDSLFAGNNASGQARRSLFRFDVASAIPSGATIASVSPSLFLAQAISGDSTLTLHRVANSWGEGGSVGSGNGAPATVGDATWTYRAFDTSSWTLAGGDFVTTASGSTTVGSTLQSYSWPSTTGLVADVQGWLDAPSSNFGWILLGDEAHARVAKRFESRETSDASHQPKLTISYTPVPEPSFAAGLCLLLGFGLRRGGRRT